jgi:hypothetical protein
MPRGPKGEKRPAASHLPGPSKNRPLVLLSEIAAGKRSPMSISRMSRAGDRQPSQGARPIAVNLAKLSIVGQFE